LFHARVLAVGAWLAVTRVTTAADLSFAAAAALDLKKYFQQLSVDDGVGRIRSQRLLGVWFQKGQGEMHTNGNWKQGR
jgi:hypothetical protein